MPFLIAKIRSEIYELKPHKCCEIGIDNKKRG
jgi:hypothetical protein